MIVPDWPAPARVRSLITTRQGGISHGVFSSFNLGDHVGDDPVSVANNRALLAAHIGIQPVWLEQVHGIRVVDATCVSTSLSEAPPKADAAFARQRGVACIVMTADCLPVLFCDQTGTVVAAAHAGWRGLLDGVLEATIAAMNVPTSQLMAYLGPAIGPRAFEVGDEVRAAFLSFNAGSKSAFQPGTSGKWFADIYQLARQRLVGEGVKQIYGGDYCTVTESERFFSYRRDGRTGRMASLVWLEQT